MKPLFESRDYYPQNNGKGFTKPQEVRRSVGKRWVGPNFKLIEAVAHTGNGMVDLWEESPVRLDSNDPNTNEIIDLLFPGNPLLCCGWTRHRFDTRPRRQWYKLQDLQFIVPSPMTAPRGTDPTGQALCSRFE